MTRVGLISDTHGLLRPEALEFLQGCDHIVHAGDIGPQTILDALGGIAPLSVVRGNNDREPWAASLPPVLRTELGGIAFVVVHDLADLYEPPSGDVTTVVVSGHSHKPRIDERGRTLHINPGSAGRRRFSLPISIGDAVIEDGQVTARIVELPG